jgi:hypothetical protein
MSLKRRNELESNYIQKLASTLDGGARPGATYAVAPV